MHCNHLRFPALCKVLELAIARASEVVLFCAPPRSFDSAPQELCHVNSL
jgi:hypothetical protein